MVKYPEIDDDEFYDKIDILYRRFKIPKSSSQSMEKYCKPKNFTLQQPQEFLSYFINPNTPYKSILIYHKIGAGKTCTAIQIAEKWKHERNIIFVLPASLKGNFRNELRSLCGGNSYLSPNERIQLSKLDPLSEEYDDIIRKSDEKIDKYYQIYSYNKFIENCKEGLISLKNSVLIIDEIQNMVSEAGTYYKQLYELIHSPGHKDLRIVLLSATPMFDKPMEIALTMNLLRLPENIPTGREFMNTFIKETIREDNNAPYYTAKNMDRFKELIKGYVSYYAGAPAFTFPKMTVRKIECEMSDFQYNIYRRMIKEDEATSGFSLNDTPSKDDVVNAVDLPNNFYMGSRFILNVVFPNKKVNEVGFESFTHKKIIRHLSDYSCKFQKIIESIKKSNGKVFIYSAFKEHAGIKSFVEVLEAFGYKNYLKHGTGPKRFAVWSGDESSEIKDEIREVFNKSDNLYGKKLKIILGSPAIKEGVSLKAVRYVHILEPYWNRSRLEQVFGRASRFCSHKDLPENKRNVKVYIYIATHPDEEQTVDQYIMKLSETKNKIIKKFEKAIKEASVDCSLNYNANKQEDDELVCH